MPPFKTIVVAVDSSKCSQDALLQAARLAAMCSARLSVIHVIDSTAVLELAAALERSASELGEQAIATAHKDIQHAIRSVGATAATIEVRIGTTDDIVRHVADLGADLLVVGRCGTASAGREIGTVAMACARRAAAHVLVVPEGHTGPFERIAVGVDFSETSKRAVAVGASLATLDTASVEVVHVFFGPWNELHYRAPTMEVSPEFQREYRQKIELQLTEFAMKAGSDLPQVSFQAALVPDHSSPGAGLLQFANQTRPDLLVVGTHGRTGVQRLVMGSTAERVVRSVECAVLVVKPAREAEQPSE